MTIREDRLYVRAKFGFDAIQWPVIVAIDEASLRYWLKQL